MQVHIPLGKRSIFQTYVSNLNKNMSESYIAATADKIQRSILKGFQMGVEDGNAGKQEMFRRFVTTQMTWTMLWILISETSVAPDRVKALKDVMHKLCKLEKDFAQESAFAQTFKCQSIEKFDEEYEIQFAEYQKTHGVAGQSQRYTNFIKDLEDIQSVMTQTFAEGSQAAQSTIVDEMTLHSLPTAIIDPITKNPIKHPVRNKNCKHVYDKESIEAAIKINDRVRCPYVGCNVKKVLVSDLLEDRELKQKLMSAQLDLQSVTMNIDDDDD